MKILVTGGCGFIGSHLVRRLVREGYMVTVMDNLCRSRLSTICDLVEGHRVRFIKKDITVPRDAEDATTDIDAVIHLAALIDASESVQNPTRYFIANFHGTVNMLQACVKNGVQRFVFASTAAVYGNSASVPVREDSPTVPVNPYGKSKLLAESCVKISSKRSGLETIVLRLFNVYGPNQRSSYAGVITKSIEMVSKGQPPIIFGDGEQTRDFVHVDDVVSAFLLSLRTRNVTGETFNIGTGDFTTVNRLAQIIIELTGQNGTAPSYMEARKGDVRDSYADINKAKSQLLYKPTISIERGLKQLLSQHTIAVKIKGVLTWQDHS